LPFRDDSFDLVICHHSLEHVADLDDVIHEIRRVLSPRGRLYVSVPDGTSFSDRLYRYLFAGGGHVQRFTYSRMVGLMESELHLHLASSTELFSSFNYIDGRNFQPAPAGPLPGPFPRRMRLLGTLPAWALTAFKFLLNVVTRAVDRHFHTTLSRYGWAFAFEPNPTESIHTESSRNVCMGCGAVPAASEMRQISRFFYRCPTCSRLNPRFRSR
jgi:SAM-dependent methyltransferase